MSSDAISSNYGDKFSGYRASEASTHKPTWAEEEEEKKKHVMHGNYNLSTGNVFECAAYGG